MFDFFVADINLPFLVALGVVALLSLVEGVGLVIGLSLMNLLDQLFPVDIDVDMDTDVSVGGLTAVLGWLCLNRLPLLIWLVLFLTAFAVVGLVYHYLLLSVGLPIGPALLSLGIALLGGTWLTRILGARLAVILPKNESTAVSQHSFSGQFAHITLGNAEAGKPAEALLRDPHGQPHYVMVEPADTGTILGQGSRVLLLEKSDGAFTAVPAPEQLP